MDISRAIQFKDKYQQTPDGRFVFYRHCPGTVGKSGSVGNRYLVHDTLTGDIHQSDSRKIIDCWVHYRVTGEMTSPWFGATAPACPKIDVVRVHD